MVAASYEAVTRIAFFLPLIFGAGCSAPEEPQSKEQPSPTMDQPSCGGGCVRPPPCNEQGLPQYIDVCACPGCTPQNDTAQNDTAQNDTAQNETPQNETPDNDTRDNDEQSE